MTEDGKYDRNIQHVLTRRMEFIVADGSAYVSFNMTYHKGIKFTKIKTKFMFDGNIRWFIMTTS